MFKRSKGWWKTTISSKLLWLMSQQFYLKKRKKQKKLFFQCSNHARTSLELQFYEIHFFVDWLKTSLIISYQTFSKFICNCKFFFNTNLNSSKKLMQNEIEKRRQD